MIITVPEWLAYMIGIYIGLRMFEVILTISLHGMEWYEDKFMDEYKRMRGNKKRLDHDESGE